MPAYNEEKNIVAAVKDVQNTMKKSTYNFEIIVVDDGSKDKTLQKARTTNAKVITYEKNKGKGGAIKIGIAAAKGTFIVIQDSDLTIPAETIPNLVEKINNGSCDACYASRLSGLAEKGAMPTYRIFGNYVLAFLLSIVTRQILKDTYSGQKVFKKEILKKIDLETTGWPDFEILVKSSKMGFKTKEYPVEYFKRREGASKMKNFTHGFWSLYQILKWTLRSN